MTLSIVIVSYKCRELLRRCLLTVREGAAPHAAQVILVDNDSRDGTVEMVRDTFPWVTLVASDANLGFAAGNNRGLRDATGDVVVFLNPDTECHPGALAMLADTLAADERLGMTAPRLLNVDGSLQPSVRGFPTVLPALLVLLKLYRFARFLPSVKRYDQRDFDYETSQDVSQPMGACMVVPRRVLDVVGAFDERYWMWFEEVDLCRRVISGGWRIRYIADARVVHALGVSSRQLATAFRQERYGDSLVTYFRLHHPGWRPRVLAAAARVGLVFVRAAQGTQAAATAARPPSAT